MNITSEQPKIIVIGSSSIDLVLNTDHLPQPNETVMAEKSESFFGGKGANQAVATSRLGSSVYFIGAVGMDPKGQQILRNLVDEGVNVGYVIETEEAATGTAYVVAAKGINSIVVVPASNYCLKPQHVAEAEKFFSTSDLVLIQLEIPMDVVEYTSDLVKKNGKKMGIYASPAKKLSEEVIENSTFIVAKSNELSIIFGDEPREQILRKYPNKLFVRDDTNSTTYFNGTEMKYYRNDHDSVLHKMGMGDAFTAGFGVALCHQNSIDDCVKFGNDVSLKVTKNRGSQSGLPYLKDIIEG
ncbi:ribokinase [Kaistella antarctica]|uniref:Ribokinase n=1 Tax=Kaistella antarctica TaxID=266748 RepID=A0A448NS44_9FLAO|nr:ribokinase [Kaistella antarctica]KEY18638.1 sugar kinase [Kaistella antarctica]SEW17184.1 ribokinase [Kaistella antarctica]VEH99776.1 Ribokinase [Kaistella antarctica]